LGGAFSVFAVPDPGAQKVARRPGNLHPLHLSNVLGQLRRVANSQKGVAIGNQPRDVEAVKKAACCYGDETVADYRTALRS
jgi:hypothetical protein